MSLKHSHNDQPTAIPCEYLGTNTFIQEVANDIRESDSPKTIAITGYWGSGKTSCLAATFQAVTGKAPTGFLDKSDIDTSNDCIGIWFEAWRYQNEQTPIVALLHTIKEQFSTSRKFVNSVGKLTSISALGALTIFDGVIKKASGLGGFDKLQAIGEKYEKDNLLTQLAPDQINDALTKAVKELLGRKKKKLVIFIDDLDRCEPEMAYKLLEGLKLYLNIPNCTVVMAIDQQQIERFLQKQFINLIPEQQQEVKSHYSYLGVEYLEKLCQEAHRLPIPSHKQKTDFFIKYANDLCNNEHLILGLKDALNKYDCLPANPRRIKMISNKCAAFLRKLDHEGFKKPDESGLYSCFTDISVDKQVELLAICTFAVARLAVSYRRVYESVELTESGAMEIFDFCKPDGSRTKFDNPSSAFYELNKDHLDTKTQGAYEHPSDLSVFKLKSLFDEDSGLADMYNTQDSVISEILHKLIMHTNKN